MRNPHEERRRQSPQLSATKQKLLEKVLGGELAHLPDRDSIVPRLSRQDPPPLSFAQERLWFLDQLEPNSAVYNIACALRVHGFLNVRVLQQSLQEIMRRHDILRTSFPVHHDGPVQLIAPEADLPLTVEDLTALASSEREDRVRQCMAEERQRPFVLSVGPLVRMKLLRLDAQEHVLLLTMHHMISDGWSMGVVIREMAQLYSAFLAGQASPLAELPIQYADFAIWQRQWLSGPILEEQLMYWRTHLEKAPTLLLLPTDRPRPAVQRFAGRSYRCRFPRSLLTRLHKLQRQEGVTGYILLLAAFEILLSRYSRQENFYVGTPVANRTRLDTEPLIGFFVNTLVIRADVAGDPTVTELLGRVREVVVGAQRHQDLPFAKVVTDLQPERNLSHSPIFQVMFTLQNIFTAPEIPVEGLRLSVMEDSEGTAKFDLHLELTETEEGLAGVFEYNTDLFDEATIARMAEHYRVLLEDVVEKPKARLSELSLLTHVEREQVIVQWNATRHTYATDLLMHEQFEARAAQTPEAVAVVFGTQTVTYRDLNRQANCVAHYLRTLGVGPEVCVGICIERSVEMVIALLGILKAGGAYVPLDPEFPQERLAFIVADAGLPVLMTQQALLGRLPAFAGTVVCLDRDWPDMSHASSANPGISLPPECMAYTIYTSGSTGQPKGVSVPHAGVLNRIQWMQETYHLTPSDRVLQKTPFMFDVSVWEFFWPLMTGARLVVAEPEVHRDPGRLQELIRSQGVTTLHFVPSMLHAFLDTVGLTSCHSLRQIFCSGEALSAEIVRKVFDQMEGVSLHNLYGPTEASIDVTFWQCLKGQAEVPIGRPIANTQIYLLDRRGRPVPVGVPGELYIGGIGLARGYRNRAKLTAETFLPDPFSERPGSRLYKTGDLARYRADGTIEYLGRLDYQVKLRGFRVELGEIEAHLRREAGIREAVAVVREDHPPSKQLVGYVVLEHDAAIDVDAVKAGLRNRLPPYMVPDTILVLESLPLSPNGKVDRSALPEPDWKAAALGCYQAPRTHVEQVLSKIWADVLRVDQVGIHDNFFERGGDSILSIQVIARARQAGLVLTPRQFFQHQTIGGLATVAVWTSGVQAEQGLVAGPIPLTPIQQWFFEQALPNPHHYNQAVLLEATAPLDVEVLKIVVEKLVRHHDALRLRFVCEGGVWRQSNEVTIPPDLVVSVDLSRLTDEQQKAAIHNEVAKWQASLDVSAGPMLRVIWFDAGTDRPKRLCIIIHHLAIDGVSWRILLEDLQTGYLQYVENQEITLPAKTTSYKVWAERLNEFIKAGGLQDEIEYWLDPRRGEIHPLPVEQVSGDATERFLEVVTASLSESETQALLQEVPAAYHTRIQEILFTALAGTLGRWANRSSLLIDVEGHGREDLLEGIDISRTVGWFTSLFPVLVDVPSDAAPGEALRSVKEQVRGIPNQGVGYGLLRYGQGTEEVAAHLRAQPAAQVRFNYLGRFNQAPGEKVLMKVAEDSAGPLHDLQSRLLYEFDLQAQVQDDCLQISWRYSGQRYNRSTVEELSHAYTESLRGLISHCCSGKDGGYSPSDFPLADLNQQELDILFGTYRGISDIYPLTPMQDGLLFHTLLNPGTGIYVMQDQYTLQGTVSVEAFTQAWRRAVERHPILRTSFVWEHLPRPLQIVHREVTLPFEILDWQHLTPAEQETRLRELLQAELNEGFNMFEAPLMRCRLIQLSKQIHTFILSYHHILLDRWSMSPLLMEFLALYAALKEGKDVTLAPVRPFRDYLVWLHKQDPTQAESYWRTTLQGFITPTRLAGAAASTSFSDQRSGMGNASLRLTRSSTDALAHVAKQWQLTPNTFVQGAWALLLHHYSHSPDVVFGITVSGRPTDMPEVESLLGLFINSLPLRVRCPPDLSVVSWLKGLLAQNITMRQYEHTPLARIHEWSEVPRGEALFESLFVFENAPMDPFLQVGDLGFGQVINAVARTHTNYPLTVVIGDGAELSLELSYDLALFDDETIRRLLNTFKTLLENMIRFPEVRLSALPLLTEEEHEQVVVAWNATAEPYPDTQSVVEHFEAQAARTPEAVAVFCDREQLSYGALHARATKVAKALRAAGVGAETVVSVLTDRGVNLLAMLIGILKAGGVYLPLDLRNPAARIQQILENSQPRVLLTSDHHQVRVSEAMEYGASGIGPTVLIIEEILRSEEEEEEILDNIPTAWLPNQLAYVIYTSGSTGMPKGAMVEHQGLFNHLWSKVKSLQLTAADVIAQTASPGFDISVWQLLAVLLCGGKVAILRDDIAHDPQRLLWYVEETGITYLETIPAVIRAMMEETPRPALSRLRGLLPTGEACPMNVGRAWQVEYPKIPLLNAYGPAECADDVALYPVSSLLPEREGSMPIGRPIANIQLYILNRYLTPVPVGCIGELCVAGTGVGRGYLKEPSRTAEFFVPNPFSSVPGTRLYKTGDLARYQADGTIEYLGRMDHQVKVRGHRIELEEIEVQMKQAASMQEAVVVVRSDRLGEKRLLAYGVTPTGESIDPKAVKSALQRRLPDYMVPDNIVLLEALPRTANGKVDRQALPVPDLAEHENPPYVAPQTPTEELLVRIWEEVLDKKSIGIHDNFFDLGGHSLLAIRIISRLRSTFETDIPLRMIFEYPSIAVLAQALVHYEAMPGQTAAIARLSRDIDSMSESEIEELLREKGVKTG